MKAYKPVLIVVVVLILDQITKFWVKTNMFLGQEITLTSWLSLHFTENMGMAFGMVLPGVWGKLFLSAFRSIAVGGGIYFIYYLLKQKAHWGFITASCLILAGAIGNMIDGSIYGLIFSDSYMGVAKLFPPKGYAGFMQGLVVDMIHVRMFNFKYNGQIYEFFPFIFNIADAAITIGVFIILIFQKWFFKEEPKTEPATTTVSTSPNENEPVV
jgi:signal peptidase II